MYEKEGKTDSYQNDFSKNSGMNLRNKKRQLSNEEEVKPKVDLENPSTARPARKAKKLSISFKEVSISDEDIYIIFENSYYEENSAWSNNSDDISVRKSKW
mmetsp:Transcript_13711/g.20391  ORF Transcript_13711/g.20391 Transcript_13711/m.20391 type:complete len:101 (+) Transcript_13711:39-341(+)